MRQDQVEPVVNSNFSVLILEDDPVCAKVLTGLVQAEGGRPVTCGSLAEARALVKERGFDIYLLDHQLPDGTGTEFFYSLRERGRLTTAIMLTAYPQLPLAVELTRDGLFDYLTKPFEVEAITSRIRRAVLRLTHPEPSWGHLNFVGHSEAIRNVQWLIRKAAANPAATVLLSGETGTGKDMTARILHDLTFQNAKAVPPFVSLSCPNLPADMFEAELFGAEKGSYTGAFQNRCGMVEAAEGGTLFLDEISEVPLTLQAKLLQFLETRAYRRLGSTDSKVFNGRIVAASNKSLIDEVRLGRFRQDLLYRLDVFSIHLPSLRERSNDISELSEALLDQLAQKYQRKKPVLNAKDVQVMENYGFPGNVRELRNLLERSLLHTSEDSNWLQIDPAWLAQARSLAMNPKPGEELRPSGRTLHPIEAKEYEMIREVLQAENGVIRRAASRLGISHQSLLRRLEKWPELRADKGSAE